MPGSSSGCWLNNKFSPNVSLQSLSIHGGSQELSHASVLFIHQLVYVSSPELHLENIHLQDEDDWRLIIDVIAFPEGPSV